MRRFWLALLILFGLVFGLAASAQAAGSPFRGRAIENSHQVIDTTGSCSCEVKWFTMALNPGTVRIDAVLKGYGEQEAPTYAIRVRVFRGSRYLTWGQVACFSSKPHCNATTQIRFHVKHPGVYYIAVEGPGAHGIQYGLTVHGGVRALHCRSGRCT